MTQRETREAWFKRGHLLPSRDNHRGDNEGLSKREIKALERENSRPWGMSIFAEKAVSQRATDAKKDVKKNGGNAKGKK